MNKRTSICIVLVIALLLSFATSIQASAQEVGREEEVNDARYEHTASTGAVLSFIDGVAVLSGSVSGYPNRTTQINGFLYLQHKIDSKWMIVKTWTGSVKDWSLDITGEATGLSSGTYRVRFVTYVFEGSESEEVVYISDEVVYKKK